VRRECLDHLLIVGERHLQHVVREYVQYSNQARPHQGIAQKIPGRFVSEAVGLQQRRIIAIPILNGLHHDYRRAGRIRCPLKKIGRGFRLAQGWRSGPGARATRAQPLPVNADHKLRAVRAIPF
jgi:hypothetical protein